MSAHPLICRWRNLLAVPSYHYHPAFAQGVRAAFQQERIDAVALELPEESEGELAWADDCWPTPVASIADGSILPFIPGDSMLEGYRLARRAHTAVYLIDLNVKGAIKRESGTRLGPEFAPRLGGLFQETMDSLLATHPKAEGDAAREAYMARRLSELLRQHERVLWIGGMAHWTAITQRLADANFSAPVVPTVRSSVFVRSRLRASALYQISTRLPCLVEDYTGRPDTFVESEALQSLALGVLSSTGDEGVEMVRHPPAPKSGIEPPESGVALDVVKMLTYAQNLAATSGVREAPDLIDLLTSASSTIGNKYAGRLYLAAMLESPSGLDQTLPNLTYEQDEEKHGFMLGSEWLFATPYWPNSSDGRSWSGFPTTVRDRLNSDAPYAELPAGNGEPAYWWAFPPEEEAYEAYVRHVLLLATRKVAREPKSEPFSTGLQDGIDMRATVRNWHRGEIHVRVGERHDLNITNAAIDYANDSEDTAILRGRRPRSLVPIGLVDPNSPRFNVDHDTGWLDPTCLHVGSISREATKGEILQQEGRPCLVVRRQREFSFITLDVPSWYRGLERERKDFIGRVTLRLADLPMEVDNLYEWLRVMFTFCRGKPFAYFSKYVPSARIHRLASAHNVRLVHIPLSVIPSRLLEMHRRFRFLRVSGPQYEALLKLIAEGKRAWVPD